MIEINWLAFIFDAFFGFGLFGLVLWSLLFPIAAVMVVVDFVKWLLQTRKLRPFTGRIGSDGLTNHERRAMARRYATTVGEKT